jgi:hypothetical protein
VTSSNFDPNSNRPDLECPDGCNGKAKQGGGHWPFGWWSWPKGTEPTRSPQQAAFDAQAPPDYAPEDSWP